MKASKEIAEKVRKYQEAQNEADRLWNEIKKYFEREADAEGFMVPFIADKPTGKLQNGDEYCDQVTLGEDWYKGKYYYQIEDSKEYVGFTYEI